MLFRCMGYAVVVAVCLVCLFLWDAGSKELKQFRLQDDLTKQKAAPATGHRASSKNDSDPITPPGVDGSFSVPSLAFTRNATAASNSITDGSIVAPNSARAPISSTTSAWEECITEIRGSRGKWIQDMDTAAQMQYIPLTTGFARAKRLWRLESVLLAEGKITNRTFMNSSTYKWVEGNDNIDDDDDEYISSNHSNQQDQHQEHLGKYRCGQLHLISLPRLCAVLRALQIDNVFLVGDSMAQAQFSSLLGLLGMNVEPPSWGSTVNCPGGNHASFRLYFDRSILYAIPKLLNATTREDIWGYDRIKVIPDWGQVGIASCPKGVMPNRPKGKGSQYTTAEGVCPWIDEYESMEGNTLLILSQGAAYHSTKTFNAMWDGVLRSLDQNQKVKQRRGDVVFFRSITPGHKDCFVTGEYEPVANYSEYMRLAETSQYAWDQFQYYNQYVKHRLEERSKYSPDDVFQMYYMNVYNMTVLRPDGHSNWNDCLHYDAPGPQDWWNNVLYTNLLDIVRARINVSVAEQLVQQEAPIPSKSRNSLA